MHVKTSRLRPRIFVLHALVQGALRLSCHVMLMSVTSVPQSAVDTKEITRYSICVAKMRIVLLCCGHQSVEPCANGQSDAPGYTEIQPESAGEHWPRIVPKGHVALPIGLQPLGGVQPGQGDIRFPVINPSACFLYGYRLFPLSRATRTRFSPLTGRQTNPGQAAHR